MPSPSTSPSSPLLNDLNALWPYLTEPERDELEALIRLEAHLDRTARPSIDPALLIDAAVKAQLEATWAPFPGSPQQRAFESLADELFYGGAAGGGKTDLLLGLALLAHHKSIIYRREFPQFRGMIARSRSLYAEVGDYNSGLHTWKFADRLRTLEFASIPHVNDLDKHQGQPHDLIGVDEGPNFLSIQYAFVRGWLRTDIPGHRCRVVMTGNPPRNSEGAWVIERWAPWLDKKHANPAKDGELRWFAVFDKDDGRGSIEHEVDGPEPFPNPDGTIDKHTGEVEILSPRSRTFIRANVEDNPIYMASGYKGTLQSLPEPLRSQLLKGDFEIGHDDHPWQIIPTRWVELAMERWERQPEPPAGALLDSIGVDVARGGKDKTVLAKRYRNWIAPLITFPGVDTPDGTAVVNDLIANWDANALDHAVANIDVVGVGSAVYDVGRLFKLRVIAFHGGEKSEATDRTKKLHFVNQRAEWHWKMREALDPDSGDDLALPPDRELLADLCAPRWEPRTNGIKVEDKEEIKDRIGRSPDKGEAVIYAVNRKELPRGSRRINLGHMAR